jgi:hypothetical protein
MKVTVSSGSVPPGTYLATLAAIEETAHEEYGAGLRFSFTIVGGPYNNWKLCRTTGRVPSLTNSLGKMLSQLLAYAIKLDEEIDVDQLVGRQYQVVVEATPTGGSRVASVGPLPIV